MKRKILITGGAGNVGGSLARRLVENEDNYVVIVDNLLTGSIDKLPKDCYKNWIFINADVNIISDISAIMTSFNFSYVYHYAAVVGVQRTLKNPKMVLNDIEGIKNILDLSKNTGVNRVFFSSSSEVYGEPVEIPQIEDTTPLNSRLPYAIVKNVSEAFCRSYYQEYGLNYTIFRFFNTYGPLQSDDFVITKFINLALQDSDITIYGDGLQTRTFCFIDDNIDTTIKIMEDDLCINDTINIGSDLTVTMVELADMVINITNSNSTKVYLPPLEEGDMTRRQPYTGKMKKVLDRRLITLEEGIVRTMDFIKAKL
ncbi:NAD-dependent epimerase/dehydratase family protein [bacterium]|jgi:UDP-glucuronate decarboxylase|nr:NAD-dependent epimerase/dehydratase family protein [bacterium]